MAAMFHSTHNTISYIPWAHIVTTLVVHVNEKNRIFEECIEGFETFCFKIGIYSSMMVKRFVAYER